MAVGDRIKNVRKYYKYSQRDFSSLLGLSQAHISNIECNKDNPSDKLLKTISSVCNVSYNWLKNNEGEMTDSDPILQNELSATIKRINSISTEENSIRSFSLINNLNELLNVFMDFKNSYHIQAISQFYSTLCNALDYYKKNYIEEQVITPENTQKNLKVKSEFDKQLSVAVKLLCSILFTEC